MKKHLIFLLFILLFVTACIGGKKLEPPHMNLMSIGLDEFRFFESSFVLELRAQNPNDVPLSIKGIDCNVDLNGKQFATGVSEAAVEIPPFSSVTIPVVVQSSAFRMLKGLYGFSSGKKGIDYRLTGKVFLNETETVKQSKLPFSSEGQVSLSDALKGAGDELF